MDTIKIKSKENTYIGYEESGMYKFIGVPYASTPRFSLPKRYETSDEIDCTKISIDCPQASSFIESDPNSFYVKEFAKTKEYLFNENIASLNIYIPKEIKDAPCVCFVHGGAFEMGCISDIPYADTTEYAKRGIILVVIGYRLNVFSSYNGANLGMHDVLFACKWVKEHIKDFGGSGKITLMGQSAGAMITSNLVISNKLDGIIDSAVVMSAFITIPNLVRPRKKIEASKYWKLLTETCKLKESRELLELDDKSLYLGYMEHTKKYPLKALLNMQPTIDGLILKDTQKSLLKKGNSQNIPIIYGMTSQDMVSPYIYHDILHTAKVLHKLGKKDVYGYFFDRCLPGNSYKAFHACDLWYMFGQMDKAWRPFEEVDYKISNNLLNYIESFIKTGNPNNESVPLWEPIYKNEKLKWFIDEENRDILPHEAKKKCWHYFLKDRGPI